MKQKPAQQLQFDLSLLSELACPACLGELRAERSQFVCKACERDYPIINGIPVLIADRAEAPAQQETAH